MLYSDNHLVTVVVLCYCQIDFIEQTINSLLSQDVNFNYKILVCDDGSFDGTSELLSALYKNNDQVDLILRKKNIGMMPNFIDALNRCDSKYIAFCDGDDYWIDNYKLSNQVKILDQQSNVDITSTKALLKYPDSNKLFKNKDTSYKQYFTFSELLKGNKVIASSVVMRNYKTFMPDWTFNAVFGDWPYYLLSMNPKSLIHISDDYTIVYRKDVGVTRKNGLRRAHFLRGTNSIYKNLLLTPKFEDFENIIEDSIHTNDFYLMGVLNQGGERLEAFNLLINLLIKNKFPTVLKVLKRYLRTLLKK